MAALDIEKLHRELFEEATKAGSAMSALDMLGAPPMNSKEFDWWLYWAAYKLGQLKRK